MHINGLLLTTLVVIAAASPIERVASFDDNPQPLAVWTELHARSTTVNASVLDSIGPSYPFTFYVFPEDPMKDRRIKQAQDAWQDATTLAAFVHTSHVNTEESFSRHFEKENSAFVSSCI